MIVISPHLDDAVWSASALIDEFAPDVRIVTICAGIPAEGTPRTVWDQKAGFPSATEGVRIRRTEDLEAARFGNFDVEHLDCLDGGYATEGEQPLEDAVASVVKEAGDETILGPLGIWHPDHVRIGRALPESAWRYEELPYAYMMDTNGSAEELAPAKWKRSAVYCYRSQIHADTHLKEILHMPERYRR